MNLESPGEHRHLLELEQAALQDVQKYAACPLADKVQTHKLSASIQAHLASIRAVTRDLELMVEEMDSDEERQDVAALLAQHKAEYARIQQALKNTALAQRQRAMASAAEERRELLSGANPLARQRQLQTDADMVAASEGITEGLRRTRQVLAEEISHTSATLAAMETSHAQLGRTRGQYQMQHGHLRKSKGLLGTLNWQNRSETYMLWAGLTLFMAVVVYIAAKRTGYFVPDALKPAALLRHAGLTAAHARRSTLHQGSVPPRSPIAAGQLPPLNSRAQAREQAAPVPAAHLQPEASLTEKEEEPQTHWQEFEEQQGTEEHVAEAGAGGQLGKEPAWQPEEAAAAEGEARDAPLEQQHLQQPGEQEAGEVAAPQDTRHATALDEYEAAAVSVSEPAATEDAAAIQTPQPAKEAVQEQQQPAAAAHLGLQQPAAARQPAAEPATAAEHAAQDAARLEPAAPTSAELQLAAATPASTAAGQAVQQQAGTQGTAASQPAAVSSSGGAAEVQQQGGWYYVDAQKQKHGPVEEAVLQAVHAQHPFKEVSLFWKRGMKGWMPLRQLPQLQQLLHGAGSAHAAARDEL